jgi:hypothetical protein
MDEAKGGNGSGPRNFGQLPPGYESIPFKEE